MTRLLGKSAFITGAAQGIGLEFAKAYVAEGAKVALADINQDRANKVASELGDTAFQTVSMKIYLYFSKVSVECGSTQQLQHLS